MNDMRRFIDIVENAGNDDSVDFEIFRAFSILEEKYERKTFSYPIDRTELEKIIENSVHQALKNTYNAAEGYSSSHIHIWRIGKESVPGHRHGKYAVTITQSAWSLAKDNSRMDDVVNISAGALMTWAKAWIASGEGDSVPMAGVNFKPYFNDFLIYAEDDEIMVKGKV